MGRTVKVIPCLDMKEGRVVKGVQFEGLRDAGDAAELARRYAEQGADEIVFLDVSASNVGRRTMDELVRRATVEIDVPVVVGGGVDSVESAGRLLRSGATTVSVNTAAIRRPELIDEIAAEFGSQALMVSLDVRTGIAPKFEVTTHGGRNGTGIDALEWAQEVERRGARSIMLNSIAEDGVQSGYDLALIEAVRQVVSIDLIASGGAGQIGDFVAAARSGANAVLAASVFHFGQVTIAEVKAALREAGFTTLGQTK